MRAEIGYLLGIKDGVAARPNWHCQDDQLKIEAQRLLKGLLNTDICSPSRNEVMPRLQLFRALPVVIQIPALPQLNTHDHARMPSGSRPSPFGPSNVNNKSSSHVRSFEQ